MKIRADQLLVKKELVPSRHQAQLLIMAGRVFSPAGRIEKSGDLLDEEITLRVEDGKKFVSRGGEKLDHALQELKISVEGKVCLDVGSSTGGFSDCLLQRGAKKIYAVDVGYGQFHWTLRQKENIVVMERTNFRYLEKDKISEKIDLCVADVSFISLTKLLPRFLLFTKAGSDVLVMVKPQFELSPVEVKKGVVRSPALREKAVKKVAEEAKKLGYKILKSTPSPILGPKGNQEIFLHLLVSKK